MINSSLKEKYWDSATDKQMVISVVGTNQKVDNSMLEIGTFALEESLCSESELKFGACEANCVKFTARNTAGNIIGKTISIEETIDGDSKNPMPYGVFKVASDVPTADRTKRQITAYDAMYDIINADVKAWYAGLSFPMTLKQFRNSFFAHLGIEQAVATLPNDSMTVNKTIVATQTDDSSAVTEESSISGKTVVTAICEINGCFGNINREGKFEYVFLKAITSALYPAEDLFPADNVFPSDVNTESMTGRYITFDYEDFQSKAITQLEIKTSEDNAGAIVGTAGNNYSITGNFLVSDKTGAELEQIANNLLPIMKQAAYTPIKSCTCVGNPCLTLGEPIRFNTTREIVETYLLQRTLTGVQSKRDSISAQGTQTHSVKVNSIRDTIESVERRTGKLERNADHLQSTYEDLEKQTSSKFEQTADAITAEVTRAQDAESSISSQISVVAGEVSSKVSRGDVVSEINQSPEQITLRGNRLVVEADNFELDANGNVVAAYCKFLCAPGTGVDMDRENGLWFNRDGIHFLYHSAYSAASGGKDSRLNISDSKIGISSGCFNISADTVFTWGGGGTADAPERKKVATREWVRQQGYTTGTIPDTSNFITGIYVSASGQSGNSGYTKNYFLRVSSSGTYKSVDASQLHVSDRRLKRDITLAEDITDAYMKLTPVHFRYKENVDGVDGHWHYGFIAQDVKQAFIDAGICSENEALVGRCAEDDTWLLDKDELHAMHTQMIQKQHKEIEQLKSENFALKGEVDILKQRLEKMEEMLNVINSKIN